MEGHPGDVPLHVPCAHHQYAHGLATTVKGIMTVAEYVAKMKTLADEMASAGKTLEDEEIVSYILVGLDLEFNPVVSAVATRV